MSTRFDWIPDWRRNKEMIVRRIRESTSPMKFVLKTKDEPVLIERWISYHLNLAGPDNIIVFDNGSCEPSVADVYDRHKDDVIFSRYDGFVDNLHRVSLFPELYAALRASAEYYSFLDTDEFMAWLDEDLSIIQDHRVVKHIADSGAPILPGTWLSNVIGFDDRFFLDVSGGGLEQGFKWGKPIISSSVEVSGFINHNVQLSRSAYGEKVPTNCVVFHLNRLSVKQRIGSNLHKLVALGALAQGASLQDVLLMELHGLPQGNVQRYVREIQALARTPEVMGDPRQRLDENTIRICADGNIALGSEEQRRVLSDFLASGRSLLRFAFGESNSR
jgi:hypothetical protein